MVSASVTALSSCLAFLSQELLPGMGEDEIIPFVHGVYQSNRKVARTGFYVGECGDS